MGLPLAAAFGRQFPTLGFDINNKRVAELQQGHDHTLEVSADELRGSAQLEFSDNPDDLSGCNVFIAVSYTHLDVYKRQTEDEDWYPNQFLYLPGEDEVEFRVAKIGTDKKATLALADDFRSSQHAVWGIIARNREQNFALNALMDPEIDFVSLLGTAGTGKTLLALAAGLAQTMDQQRYREIIMTRATVSVGEDIGFLPGTEEEKMTPWMGALTDNLEVLTHNQDGGAWGLSLIHI